MPVMRVVPWALWAALLVFTLGTFAGLPDEIPQHIAASGRATSTVPTTLVGWLLLPGVALATVAGLTFVSAWLLPRKPESFNFPEKARFLALPPQHRASVIPSMQLTIDAISACTMLLLLGVQFLRWRLALGDGGQGTVGMLVAGGVLLAPVALVLMSRVSAAVHEAERRAKAAR